MFNIIFNTIIVIQWLQKLFENNNEAANLVFWYYVPIFFLIGLLVIGFILGLILGVLSLFNPNIKDKVIKVIRKI